MTTFYIATIYVVLFLPICMLCRLSVKHYDKLFKEVIVVHTWINRQNCLDMFKVFIVNQISINDLSNVLSCM